MKENTALELNIEVIAPKDQLTIFPNEGGGVSIKQFGFAGEAIIAIELDDLKPLIDGLRLLQKELRK
jgi:hypothetical protein